MPIDWSRPVQTRDGVTGIVMERAPYQVRTGDTRRRVLIDTGAKWPTVFLYDEQGRCNTGGAESPNDLHNVADTLAKAA